MTQHNAVGPSSIKRFNTTIEDEMTAFDQLDPRIQDIIRTAPVSFCAAQILILQETHGVEETLRRGLRLIQETFPGYRPI